MKASEFIEKLSVDLAALQSDGRKMLQIENLRRYLAEARSGVIEAEAKRQEYHVDYRLTFYKAQNDWGLEMFRSVMGFANVAIKSMLLINGGAAVAMLAFIGNLTTKAPASPIGPFGWPLFLFVMGVLAGSVCATFSYVTQYFYTHEHKKTGGILHLVTIVCALAAYVCFFLGAYEAYSRIARM